MATSVHKFSLTVLAISVLVIIVYATSRGKTELPIAESLSIADATSAFPKSTPDTLSERPPKIATSVLTEGGKVESSAQAPTEKSNVSFAQLAELAESSKGDASIEGIVVDKQGKPLAGMSIISGDVFAPSLPPTKSDSEGKFSASELVAGEHKIMAVPAVSGGYGFDSGRHTFKLSSGQALTGIRLVYEGATHRTVAGKVTDASGVPIAGARIDASNPTSSFAFSSFTETGTDGRFVLEAREGRNFLVSVTHPSYTTFHSGRLEAGTNDLEVVLEGLGTITGQVVDAATGNPVTQFEAGSGARWSANMFDIGRDLSPKFDDPEGRFTLPSVEVGQAKVYVRAPGCAPLRVEVSDLRSDEVRDIGVVRVMFGASLEGTVTDMNGAPISRALILLGGARDSAMVPPYFSTSRFHGEQYHAMTDDEGRFEIDSLSPELTEITLEHADHPRTVGTIPLEMGKRTSLQLVMTGFATVEGTLYVNGHKAGPRNSVSVQSDSMTVSRSAETDDNGFYRIEEVPGGTVTVQAGSSEGGAHRSVETEVATTLGYTTVVDLHIEFGSATITGTVQWEGEPVSNASVNAAEVDGEDLAHSMVSPDGTFEISGLTGVEYKVYVADVMSEKPRILGSARGTVAAGETVVVDIACGE